MFLNIEKSTEQDQQWSLQWLVKTNLGQEYILSQASPGFYVFAVQVFLKTLWEKEKLLVTSNFSFSHSVFCPIG